MIYLLSHPPSPICALIESYSLQRLINHIPPTSPPQLPLITFVPCCCQHLHLFIMPAQPRAVPSVVLLPLWYCLYVRLYVVMWKWGVLRRTWAAVKRCWKRMGGYFKSQTAHLITGPTYRSSPHAEFTALMEVDGRRYPGTGLHLQAGTKMLYRCWRQAAELVLVMVDKWWMKKGILCTSVSFKRVNLHCVTCE